MRRNMTLIVNTPDEEFARKQVTENWYKDYDVTITDCHYTARYHGFQISFFYEDYADYETDVN